MTSELPGHRRARLILGLCVAAFVVAAVVVGTLLNNAGTSSTAGGSPPTSRATSPNSPTVPTTQATQPPTSPAPFAAIPPIVGKRTTTEVEPGAPASAALPLSKPAPALYSGPIPKSASASGKLVKGFPSAISVATGSTITNSSISSSGSIMQVTLVARSTASPSKVAAYYVAAFAKLGIPKVSLPANAGSTAYSFARNNDTVTITITPATGGCRYTVFGVLHATS